MSRKQFLPTDEQNDVVRHPRSAFISACPGAGKTQVLIERARRELSTNRTGQGLAFLSFTNAAVGELRSRLQFEGLLPNPVFPHYVGTFDAFLWQFFIAPLGIPGHAKAPQLILDMDDRLIAPYEGAQSVSLSCFDRDTGKMIPDKSKLEGFDAAANPGWTAKYEASAKQSRERFMARGELGFSDVRAVVKGHLANISLSANLSKALAARFCEIVVDEAQDCNPADIGIVNWLRIAGIATKVICDPHQSIYGFRGGVTEELFALRNSFDASDRLVMTGNFRSSPNICKAIAAFRAPGEQQPTDQSLGPSASDATKIHILRYGGNSTPATIGQKFKALVESLGLSLLDCPVISSTRDAACKAIGQSADAKAQDRTLRLAFAITGFYAAAEVNARKTALEALHGITLELGGAMGGKTYHQHVVAIGAKMDEWRPLMLELCQSLWYDGGRYGSADAWLNTARILLSPYLAINGATIAQKLRNHALLGSILTCKPMSGLSARTIHSVKGMEFPAVCVVMTKTNCKDIVDYLSSGQPEGSAEAARKLYVAASRAERLLVIALPKSQGTRLAQHIRKTGAEVAEMLLT
jgi:DNA helicase-2/ATP-dependent DNA helicase PcrA